ncbi:universal stress protein [Paraburkholderia sp. CNPSo 3274]|uniref:universal stress protein n=1 Tax=Paraburkholderia sp. CNPSo 3274 TaxID=2940932 RepID=UPI0020B794BE|nr:universal stress protein [Paraburkholderia sp. CNPSo 3274]MCP3710042.1 universal stress protein [Paraburkholderia sp. CNPSo 3274]
MYEKILVAYDGSETSERALAEALKLASLTGAQLRVVYALDIVALMGVGMGLTYVPAEMIRAYRTDAMKQLEEARTQATSAGVRCETELLDVQDMNDNVAQCLRRCASSHGAQLVVLGTHGRRGIKRALLGSVAEQFVRSAPCPILLVRGADK